MRFGLALVVVAVLILGTNTGMVRAEDRPPPAAEPPPPSSRLALGLSVALPLAGYGMLAGAAAADVKTLTTIVMGTGVTLALLGPSGGNLYTRRPGRALAFTGGRLALAVVGLAAASDAISLGDSSESYYDRDKSRSLMRWAMTCGAGILVLSVWESIDNYLSAGAVEEARARQSLAFAPMLVPDGHSITVGGVSLTGTF